MTLLLGLGLIAAGTAVAGRLVLWAIRGGVATDIEAFAVGLIPIGAWLVHYVVRKRYYLQVRTDADDRKLVFRSTATEPDVRAFSDAVSRALPCSVRVELPAMGQALR